MNFLCSRSHLKVWAGELGSAVPSRIDSTILQIHDIFGMRMDPLIVRSTTIGNPLFLLTRWTNLEYKQLPNSRFLDVVLYTVIKHIENIHNIEPIIEHEQS